MPLCRKNFYFWHIYLGGNNKKPISDECIWQYRVQAPQAKSLQNKEKLYFKFDSKVPSVQIEKKSLLLFEKWKKLTDGFEKNRMSEHLVFFSSCLARLFSSHTVLPHRSVYGTFNVTILFMFVSFLIDFIRRFDVVQ